MSDRKVHPESTVSDRTSSLEATPWTPIQKILTFEAFSALRPKFANQTLVQCHGVFDLLHIGHIKHFKQARSFGDVLVVTITPDRFVNKGPGHPAFHEHLRAEAVAALDCVNYVIINAWPTAVEAIQIIKPVLYVKGEEYRNDSNDLTCKIREELDAVESVGGTVRFTSDITFSSSSLINKYLPTFPPHVQKWLADFSGRYSTTELIAHLDSLEKFKVLVVGETILDAYCYCETMGKSGKEPVLATRLLYEELYTGGVLAVANHVAGFCRNVHVLSHLGKNLENREFIESRMHANVSMQFLPKPDSPTLVKRRFVEKYLNQKMFEVYEMNDSPLPEKNEQKYLQALSKAIGKADLVIVADYGHGIISAKVARFLSENAKFLVVNPQANAGNKGLNSVLKYPSAHMITMTGRELAMEVRTEKELPKHMPAICNQLSAKKMLLTMGQDGLVTWSPTTGYIDAPAFAVKVIDRVGAGDAVLSLTALLEYSNVPDDVICFMGNVAGAEAVVTMGNSAFLTKNDLKKHISHLLK